MTETPILPGARVRYAEGILGTVEHVDRQEEQGAAGMLTVRARHGEQRYRLPLSTVVAIGEESEQSVAYTVVHVAVSARELDGYAALDETTALQAPAHPRIAEATVAETPPREDAPLLALPLVEEQLMVRTQPVLLSTVHLHKGVQTEEQVLRVPVAREEVIVERIPASAFDAAAAPDGDETIVPVFEERLVVETRRVIVEYIRIRRQRVVEEQEVRGLVRREVLDISERPAGEMPRTDRRPAEPLPPDGEGTPG